MKIEAQTITLKMKLHVRAKYDGQPEFSLFGCDMSEYGHVLLGEQQITLDIPAMDTTAREIDLLKAARDKILAEARVKAARIDEQIQSLLAIEYKPSGVAA